MSNESTEQTAELTTEQKDFKFRTLLNKALAKFEEVRDIATELDHANELSIDLYDLEEVITSVENLCNTAQGLDNEDDNDTVDG